MVYCAVYGCNNNNQLKNSRKLSYFRFPRDKPSRQAWIAYTRRDFRPTKFHKLCEEHFSPTCYVRDPTLMASLEMSSPYCRPRLKPDAVPDMPLNQTPRIQDGASAGSPTTLTLPVSTERGAFAKRRRAEILSSAFEEFSREPEPTVSIEDTPSPMDTDEEHVATTGISPDDISREPTVSAEDTPMVAAHPHSQPVPVATANKKVQVKMKPPQRTRAHQTATQTVSTREFGTQTDSTITKVNLCVSVPDVNYNEDEDVDEESDDEDGNDSSSDYEPELDDCLYDECDDDDDGEGEVLGTNYDLKGEVPPSEEKQFLVSESSLRELLSKCRYCDAACSPTIKFTRGTLLVTESKCCNGHSYIWKSQQCHKTLPWSNLITASAILTSGSNASKVLQMFKNMKVLMFSGRTYSRLQSLYVIPSVLQTWEYHQTQLLQDMAGREVVLGGDARCDSPGYSAKYGSYSLMDLEANKILETNLVQCNEVGNSTRMELEGLKRGLSFLSKHVQIKALVTDRHSMVKKYMREEHQDKKHYFDVWHVAKGISKKLEATSKKRQGAVIRPWIKAIVNHLHWVSASCNGNGELVTAKWLSMLNHITNKHHGHSDDYPECEHGEVGEMADRCWLTQGSVPFKLMKEVVASEYLMRDLPKLSPAHQTYGLEVFHSVVNHYAPKSTHFQYAAMNARMCIAVLHYNENSDRTQDTTKDGQLKYAVSYPKAKKGTAAVVKPCKPPPTFGYVTLIQEAIVERRLHECPTYRDAANDISTGKEDEPRPVTSTFERFNKDDLIQQHRSRFHR